MEGQNEAPGTGPLMTSGEAAAKLRVSRATLKSWRKRGALKALKTPGGELRYRPEDVRDVLQEVVEV